MVKYPFVDHAASAVTFVLHEMRLHACVPLPESECNRMISADISREEQDDDDATAGRNCL